LLFSAQEERDVFVKHFSGIFYAPLGILKKESWAAFPGEHQSTEARTTILAFMQGVAIVGNPVWA
jgi:hypothetical protein